MNHVVFVGRIRFVVALTVAMSAGCKPPEPKAPATGAASQSEPAQPQTAVPRDEVRPADSIAAAVEDKPAPGPDLLAPGNDPPQEPIARNEDGPQGRTAFYRADMAPAEIPPVIMSKGNEALCRMKVGDAMPEIKLPQVRGRGEGQLSKMYGEKATVVVFWKSDRRMAHQELADLGPDVIEPFGENGVVLIGVAVSESPDSAAAALKKNGADFPNLLDAAGEAFAQVGSQTLPRTYLLDPQGKILWFDIEYSLATRRELHQALRAVAGDAAAQQE